jgi:hypothetical protein
MEKAKEYIYKDAGWHNESHWKKIAIEAQMIIIETKEKEGELIKRLEAVQKDNGELAALVDKVLNIAFLVNPDNPEQVIKYLIRNHKNANQNCTQCEFSKEPNNKCDKNQKCPISRLDDRLPFWLDKNETIYDLKNPTLDSEIIEECKESAENAKPRKITGTALPNVPIVDIINLKDELITLTNEIITECNRIANENNDRVDREFNEKIDASTDTIEQATSDLKQLATRIEDEWIRVAKGYAEIEVKNKTNNEN